MLAKGPFTNVARDSDDVESEWCGHWHDDADEANLCVWVPSDRSLSVYITHRDHFEPFVECVHELHPAECLRCLRLECIHLNDPEECERCVKLSQLEDADPADTPEVQEGSAGAGGLDPGQPGDQRPVGDESQEAT